MVISKNKSSTKKQVAKESTEKIVSSSSTTNTQSSASKMSSKIVSTSSTSSTVTQGESKVGSVVVSEFLPIAQENLLKKSSSSNKVSKASSSKMSSTSSHDQNFYSATSSSSATKSLNMSQLKNVNEDFLRGERLQIGNIDSGDSKSDVIFIESIDLQNVASDHAIKNNFGDLVSIEIQSKDTRAKSSENGFNTNAHLKSEIKNKNDVITENGKSSNTTMLMTQSTDSKSNIVGSNTLMENIENVSIINEGSSHYGESSSIQKISNSNQQFHSSSSSYQSESVFNQSASMKQMQATSSLKEIKSDNLEATSVMSKQIGASDSTTTYTSKVFDDNSKSWIVVEQSSVNEKDMLIPVNEIKYVESKSGASLISSNENALLHDIVTSRSTSNDSKTLNSNKLVSSDSQIRSSSTKETSEKKSSTRKESIRDEKIESTTQSETVQVYDTKSKTWKNVDIKTMEKQKKPSYIRYKSQDAEGNWHTIYKRKWFDNISKEWRMIDEKIIRGDDAIKLAEIPEMLENVSNVTTTTYTTKLFDTKTGKWTIVEEKSYVDTEPVNVTHEIKQEIEKDNPDIANIITTTETTKVGSSTFV
jgi:hypothetical protein